MKKILIIGQAPPSHSQSVPYDSTMLYEMLSWAGISKEQAQEIFEFDAVIGHFPGFKDGGHKLPTYQQYREYLKQGLRSKIEAADKVWLLGAIAEKFVYDMDGSEHGLAFKTTLITLHPSYRNKDRIMRLKANLTEWIKEFVETPVEPKVTPLEE